MQGAFNPLSMSHIWLWKHPTFKFFSSLFDVNGEVLLQLYIKMIDLQCSGDLKIKFLPWYIFDFYIEQYVLIWIIPQYYLLHSASSEHVWHYTPQWTVFFFLLKWSMPRFRCVHRCQIINCLMSSCCQLPHLTLILYLFIIANNIRSLSYQLWLLPCGL